MRFFNTAEATNPKDHYFLPCRLDWKQLSDFIEKNTTSFSMFQDKAEKQQRLLNL